VAFDDNGTFVAAASGRHVILISRQRTTVLESQQNDEMRASVRT